MNHDDAQLALLPDPPFTIGAWEQRYADARQALFDCLQSQDAFECLQTYFRARDLMGAPSDTVKNDGFIVDFLIDRSPDPREQIKIAAAWVNNGASDPLVGLVMAAESHAQRVLVTLCDEVDELAPRRADWPRIVTAVNDCYALLRKRGAIA